METVSTCVWRGCPYPVMQNADGAHCREHAHAACAHCGAPATHVCAAAQCGQPLCDRCACTAPGNKHGRYWVDPAAKAAEAEAAEAKAAEKKADATSDGLAVGFCVAIDINRDYEGETKLLALTGVTNWADACAAAHRLVTRYVADGYAVHYAAVMRVAKLAAVDVARIRDDAKRREREEAEAAEARKELQLLARLKAKYEGS